MSTSHVRMSNINNPCKNVKCQPDNQRMSIVNQTIKGCEMSTRQSKNAKCQSSNQDNIQD